MATATLDFNNLFPASYVETQVWNGPVVEDGYRLIGNIGVPEFTQFYSYGSGDAAGGVAHDGPGVLSNPDSYSGTNRLTRVDGQPFDLASIKLDYVTVAFLDGVARPAIVTFTGQKPNGVAATSTLTTDLVPGLQTFAFGPDFAGVTSVTWTVENTFEYPFEGLTYVAYQQNQFDDIVVNDPDAPPPPPPPSSTTTTIGSGPDTLALRVSQDAYQGSARYTVSVDGAQVGGIQTATATRGSGQSDTVRVLGDWAVGGHTASVEFLNDEYGGTAANDRNLYIDGATYNGVDVAGAARSLFSAGPASFGFTEAGPPPPSVGATTTIGSGPDALVLRITQDFYLASAQYTVSVDGVQINGTLTAQALRGGGQADTITVLGDWAPGGHTVSISFLNDAWGGTAATDRNLYLEGATYGGAAVPGATAVFERPGAQSFSFTEAGAAPPPGGATATVGSGPDTLALRITQDAYQGSAQYTVAVDGAQVGGTLTAQALRGSGQADAVSVRGDWAAGGHTATITFLNDRWDGTSTTDRNLFVEGATYNGAEIAGSARSLLSGGPASFDFTEAGPAPTPGSVTVGSGSDALVLRISQDAYQGSAQYTVSVDGVQIGGTLTAQALRGGGQSDTVTVRGDWAPGSHTAAVAFLNDAWGGTAATDRNLYLDGATYNGAAVAGATAIFEREGLQGFGFTDASPIA